MADISFSIARNSLAEGGSSTVTEGTSAPGAGDLEVRISGTAGWTKLEIEEAMDRIWRFLMDVNNSTSVIL